MQRDAVIDDGAGKRRYAGQFYITATSAFQTRALRMLSTSIELIGESEEFQRSGERVIILRVPDADLEATMAAVRVLPGVHFVDKNAISRLAAVRNDP